MNNTSPPPAVELKDVAEAIFRKPPGPERSVELGLTEESADQFINDPSASPEFEVFTDLARLGVGILWGKDAKLCQLTREQFDLLQQYMRSMGVKLVIRCNDEGCDPWDHVQNGGTIRYLRIAVEHLPRR